MPTRPSGSERQPSHGAGPTSSAARRTDRHRLNWWRRSPVRVAG
jgi:hypothetical protein